MCNFKTFYYGNLKQIYKLREQYNEPSCTLNPA